MTRLLFHAAPGNERQCQSFIFDAQGPKQYNVSLLGKVIGSYRNKWAAKMTMEKHKGSVVVDIIHNEIIFGVPD